MLNCQRDENDLFKCKTSIKHKSKSIQSFKSAKRHNQNYYRERNKVTVVIKCDLVREPIIERASNQGKFKIARESTLNPVIRSISHFDYDDPLTEKKYQQNSRGKSDNSKANQKESLLNKLGNLEDALK